MKPAPRLEKARDRLWRAYHALLPKTEQIGHLARQRVARENLSPGLDELPERELLELPERDELLEFPERELPDVDDDLLLGVVDDDLLFALPELPLP